MFKSIFNKIVNAFKPKPAPSPIVKHIPSDIEKQIDSILSNQLALYKNLLKFNPSLRYWRDVFKSMAKAESSFDVLSRYEEKGISDPDAVTGLKNWSEGLFQLSYQDAKYHGALFNWSVDKSKSAYDKTKTIFDVFNQVDAALKILDKQLGSKGTLINESSYWAVLRPSRPGHKNFLANMKMYQAVTDSTGPVIIDPVVTKPVEQPKQETKKMRIAFIEGHGDKSGNTIDTGSLHYNGKTELTYTREVTKRLIERREEIIHDIEIFQQYPSVGECAKKVIAWKPDASFELHTNAYNGKAKGCQAQVLSNDPASFKLAKLFSDMFCSKFGRVLRDSDGVLEMGRKERGIYNLSVVEALPASVLCEPFFGDNKSDYVSVEEYVSFWIEFLNSL